MKENSRLFLESIKVAYRKDYIKILSVFLLFFLLFSLIYLSIDRFTSLDDQFFNIKFSQLIRENGISVFGDFHWIYFSKVSQENQAVFSNPLFYIFLTLFTYVNPLFLGIKLCAIIFATILFVALYYFLLKMKEKNAFFWIILFFSISSYGFIWKMLMARAFVVAPAILLLLLLFAYKRKYNMIFIISFLYFFWHTATFFLPVGVVFVYFLFENFYGKKLNSRLIGSSFGGVFAAILFTFVFYPGGFANLVHSFGTIYGIFHDTIIGKSVPIAEGAELYGVKFFDMIKSSFFIFFMLIIAISFEVYNYISSKKIDKTEIKEDLDKKILRGALFFLSIIFFLGMFITARNADFFNFFAFAYITLSFNLLMRYLSFSNIIVKKSVICGFVVAVAYLFISNSLFLYDMIASTGSYDKIQNSAEWLRDNTNEHEIVFNVTWNWFPTLFYYNTHNYYIAGAEPRNLYDYSPELYWTWSNISQKGFVCPQPECPEIQNQQAYYLKNDERKKIWYNKEGDAVADAIIDKFKSHYIVTSKEFARLNDLMNNSSRFEKVYTDNIYNTFFVYKIK